MYVNEIFAGEFAKDGFESHMATLVDKEHYLALADSYLTCKFGMRNAQYTMPVLTELYQADWNSAIRSGINAGRRKDLESGAAL